MGENQSGSSTTTSGFTGEEHRIQQRSEEWFNLRRNTLLTSSQFGDAIGVGKGKPYDFFLSLISEDSIFECDDSIMAILQHGIETEVIIKESYEMLTGNVVKESGFWVPQKNDPMRNLIGASPDGLVVDSMNNDLYLGLTEFKAPVHKMYSGNGLIKGIPRHYMAQVQGQMAVVGATWCDFLAVCTKTKEIILKRVHYNAQYWSHIKKIITQFCHTLQEARVRESFGQDPTEFLSAKELRGRPVQTQKFPGEDTIIVKDLLQMKNNMFRGPSNVYMSFDLLMGYPPETKRNCDTEEIFNEIDHEIQRKRRKLEV